MTSAWPVAIRTSGSGAAAESGDLIEGSTGLRRFTSSPGYTNPGLIEIRATAAMWAGVHTACAATKSAV